MIKQPPNLKKGDTIGIVCTSGCLEKNKVENCVQALTSWGFNVEIGNTVGNKNNYFSGTASERLNDLQQMINDKNINAILCGRGGYGLCEIIDKIDFSVFKKSPKWIIGYSDITLLHSHINKNYKIATLHSPMASAFANVAIQDEYILSLKNSLLGKKNKFSAAYHSYNKLGSATAELVGGNLCMLTHTLATKSEYNTKGKILFIEDIGEYLYNIDRMLWQLKRANYFKEIVGLIVGGFTDMKDTTLPFGKSIEDIIAIHFAEANFPIAFHFPVGHQTQNYALKVGGIYNLNITKKKTTLTEL